MGRETLVWLALAVLALFALGGLMLIAASREQERITVVLQAQIDWQRQQTARVAETAATAHGRIDKLENELRLLRSEIGWADDQHKTRLLTGVARLPLPTDGEKR